MVTDAQMNQMFKSLEELTKQLKMKNTFSGTREAESIRLSRKGAANAKAVRDSSDQIEILADSLQDLHKSMKSGGKTLSQHFEGLIKVVNPLKVAFEKLDDVVDSINDKQREIAKAAADFVKQQKGNVEDIKRVHKAYSEYVEVITELTKIQEDKTRDETKVAAGLSRAADLYDELQKSSLFKGKKIIGGNLEQYLKALEGNKGLRLGKATLQKLGDDVIQLGENFKTTNKVMTSFLDSMTTTVKNAQKNFDEAVSSFAKSLGPALVKDAKEIPNFISSRLRYGFESNEFMDAFRMGMSSDELNQMRSANRDVINALGGFGKNLEFVSTDSLRIWSDNAKSVGLIGQEAAQFTSDWMRNAYNTGRQYNDQLNRELTDQTMIIQQAFGGSIQESAKMIQDYTSQIYNIDRFNKAQTAEQQAVLQKELNTRMLHTKYMGYDIEYMKQQDLMRHNAQFGDIADRIRGAVMGQVSAQDLGGRLGWSAQDQELWSKSRRPGAKLTDVENARLLELNSGVANMKRNYESAATNAGSVSGYISALAPNIVTERFLQQSGGATLQDITDGDTRAAAQRRARGDISFDDYLKKMTADADSQKNSLSRIEGYLQEIAETGRGLGSLPGAALIGALAGGIAQIIIAMLNKRLALGALRALFRGGGGAGGLAGAAGAAGSGAGGLAGAAGGAGSAAATWGGRLLKGAKGGILGLLGGVALDAGADALGRDTKGGAGLDIASSALAWGGTGALIGSVIPGVGTAIGGGLGALAGAAYGTVNNSKTLFGIDAMPDFSDPKTWVQMAAGGPVLAIASKIASEIGNSPRDAARTTTNLNGVYDAAAGIQRDANGNPIATKDQSLEKLVEINQQQLDEMKDSRKETNERAEAQAAAEQVRSRASLRMEELSNAVTMKF